MNNIVSILKDKIKESDIEDSIDLAYYFGEFLFYNELPVFDVSLIEEYLIERVTQKNNSFCFQEFENKGDLFLVTQPYITGGHTRLMENLSLMIDSEKHLLITRGVDNFTKQRLGAYFSQINTLYRSRDEESTEYVYRLVKELVNYNRLILNIHPEDIFSVIACGIAKKIKNSLKVFFVNHADHAFTYGASVADFWFEISLYGREVDKLRNIKGKKTFIGIPINKPDSIFFDRVEYPKLDNATNFISAASYVKYKPCRKSKIFPLLYMILTEKSNSSIKIIGVNIFKNYWWWIPKLRFCKRLITYRSLPYDDYIRATSEADYYIDSYPMPGGTAFVEQFIQGIPCIGLKSDFFGYTPLECVKKKSCAEVIDMLRNPPRQDEIISIQERIFSVHGFSQVKKRFVGAIDTGEIYSNPMIEYIEDTGIRDFHKKRFTFSARYLIFLYKLDRIVFLKSLFLAKPLSIIKMSFFAVYQYVKYR